MNVGICAGCQQEKEIKARGYCRACYQQWKRTGSTERERMPRGMCTIPGCDKPAHGRGVCEMHIRRMKVSGSYDDPRADNDQLRTYHRLYAQWQSYLREGAYPIAPEWKADFFVFLAAVGERPSPSHRLNRIDKSLPMGPGNFEWREKLITRSNEETQQEYNTRHQRARRTVNGQGSWDSDLRHKYGRDFGLRELRAMAEDQDHKCAICGQPETVLRNGLTKHLAVDHDHKTGLVRALLCSGCNTALGKFKDDPTLLLKAIAYLAKHGIVGPA